MVANLMNALGVKPKATADKLLGSRSTTSTSWAAKADLYFRAMTRDDTHTEQNDN